MCDEADGEVLNVTVNTGHGFRVFSPFCGKKSPQKKTFQCTQKKNASTVFLLDQ